MTLYLYQLLNDKLGNNADNLLPLSIYMPYDVLYCHYQNALITLYNLDYANHPLTTLYNFFNDYIGTVSLIKNGPYFKVTFIDNKTRLSYEFDTFYEFIKKGYDSILYLALDDLFRTNKDRSLEFSDMILSIKHLRPQEILDKLTSDISIYMTLDVSLLYLLINYEHIAILKDKSIINRHQYLLRDLFPDESYY